MTARVRLATAIAAGALAALAAAGSPGAAAADPTLNYGCSPPLPRTPGNCAIWHTAPVTLAWSWDLNSVAVPGLPGSVCDSPVLYSSDTAGTNVMCAVWDLVTHKIVNDTATVRLDMTPPVVTGMTPSRPADHNGWWNRPVSFAFSGTDATSGISGCETIDFAGPDGDLVPVTGGCRDVAGNAASGTFVTKYDATPPSVTAGASDALDGRNALSWTTSPDVVATRVSRSPGTGGSAVTDVYSGSDRSFSDSAVTGGQTYTYTIYGADAAGNVASAVMPVTAKPAPQAQGSTKKVPGLPRLHWRKVRGADYYNVQLYRGARKIMSAWPRLTRLQLQNRWTYRGRHRVLTAGSYHWYVWPGYGKRSAHRYGRLIAHRRFKIEVPTTQAARR